jgi:GNAT superfamily N-acetyltransferase
VTHPGTVELVPLRPAHAPEAAALVAARIAALRTRVPAVPEAWTVEAAIARLVGELATRGAGVAALRGDRLVGFHAAALIDGHGGRWSYTPDIGHAVADGVGDRVVEEMYAQLAEGWARDACLEHVVTVLAGDTVTLDTLVRLGFGQLVIDLVRDLSPAEGSRDLPGIEVRRAGPADAPAIAALDAGLRRHLRSSPVFLLGRAPRPAELERRTLADPDVATFLAEAEGEAVAMLRIGPPATDVATVVRDPGTASITAAFTVEDRRGDGIATCLLDAALEWARDAGYVRSAVDHESANGEAWRFWARHFTPVAVSLVRRLPPGIMP